MLVTVDQLISYISRFFTLKTGDLLFTGTPVGVGPVAVGDLLEGYIENQKVLQCRCK
jgi:2-keto-4-pentenoate hydratase/2-oxohepta-3-ene-1,7-dioic acid hydratase in catechol pathway